MAEVVAEPVANKILIDVSNPIHGKIASFFSNTIDNSQLSNDIGKEFLRLNLISKAQTVQSVKDDKKLITFLYDKFGTRFADTWQASVFGKEFRISDSDIFYRCHGERSLNDYLRNLHPNMSIVHVLQFIKKAAKLSKLTNDGIRDLIEGFPLIDAPDKRGTTFY